ncbi:MAG: hypothetical protein JSW63_07910 [Ignavibacterium sp.]|nr:MAG: hypothetical protein JSW63_07910 [Ignavibacterium sp.]
MSSVRIILLFSIIIIIAISCSTSEKINDKSSFDVVQATVDAWFDLMPGPSPGRIHLQGKIKLANSSSEDIKNLSLKAITVHSNQEVIYNFKPYFKPIIKDDDYSLNTGISKEFSFDTESGMKIDSNVEKINVVDVKLNFTFDEDNFEYEIKDVEIKRVY